MADSYLGRSSVIFLVIVLIVKSNHGLSVDKPHSLDIDASSVWIYASTISEVSKIVKFRSYGRSTTMDSKIVTPRDVKCRLILKLVKAFMMANLIVLSGDVSVNPGPSFGRVDFGKAAQVQGQGQGTITDTTVFGKLHTRGISISHLNVRGLRSCLDELRLLLKNQTIDVFSISESWLNINICDEELQIEGYNLIRKDRSYANDQRCHGEVHHGGVGATLSRLRTKFWVVKGRQMVKKILSRCVVCKKLEGRPCSV